MAVSHRGQRQAGRDRSGQPRDDAPLGSAGDQPPARPDRRRRTGRRPHPRLAAGRRAGGDRAALRRPAGRQRPQRRRHRRPAGRARAPGRPAGHRPARPALAPARRAVRRRRLAASFAAAEPVSLAVVGLAPDGSADYGFHVLGAADWQWTDDELARVPGADGDPARRLDQQLDAAGLRRVARLVERDAPRGAAHWSASTPTSGRCSPTARSAEPRQRRGRGPRPAGPAGRRRRRRQGQRRGPRLAGAGRATSIAAAGRWAQRGPALVLLTDGGPPLRVARPGRPLLHRPIPRVDDRRHRGRRGRPGRRTVRGAARPASPRRRPGGPGRRRPARGGGRRRAGRRR